MFADPAVELNRLAMKYADATMDAPWATWDANGYQSALQDSTFDWAQEDGSWNAWMNEALKDTSMFPPQMLAALRARAAASYFSQSPLGFGNLWDRDSAGGPSSRFSSNPPGLGNGATDAQSRKVFVGGVPQDMEAKDLIEMFGEYGDVQQAWVQRFRKNATTKNGTKHSHRGFGFVVFVEPSSVYRLLGLSQNRMLNLPDGRRLEVKRAVSSSALKAFEPSEPMEATEPVEPMEVPEPPEPAPAQMVYNI
jgi:hypothetical protein